MNTKSLALPNTLWRNLAAVLLLAAVTALTARITIPLPFTPVPLTLQTLAVILSGLVLGARGGAAAQLVYLGLIAAGLPFDAKGLGPAVFWGPTAGYLLGFVAAALVTGWLAAQLARWSRWGHLAAALAGVGVIYLLGASWLAVSVGSWPAAWWGGVAPFILVDLGKAALAAVMIPAQR